jgi:hypothetical protein
VCEEFWGCESKSLRKILGGGGRVGNRPGGLQGPSAWTVLGMTWPVYKNDRLRLCKKPFCINISGSGF